MKTNTWPALAELAQALESKTARALNPAVFDAIADRLESALAASDNAELATIAAYLEDIARQWMAAGSDAIRMALRGDAEADDDLVSLFVGGRLAFAQNLAARALDRRADDAFYDLIVDQRYKAYICALLSGAKTGIQLSEIVDEAVETVSRKLKVLEEAGVVRRRKSGQATLNLLMPAARLYAESRRLSPTGGHVVQSAVQTALMARSERMPDHLQASPVLGPEPVGAG